MEREVYLYPYSQADARRLGESSLWQASFQANVSCARDIEGAIRACSKIQRRIYQSKSEF